MNILKVALVTILVGISLISEGADEPKLAPGQGFLWVDHKSGKKFLEHIGYANSLLSIISRDETGDHLFVQFEDSRGSHKVAIVSSNGIIVKDLPGQSILNGDGIPLFWRRAYADTFEFANGFRLPTKIYPSDFISDGRFMVLFDTNNWWIARVESPLEKILTFDSSRRIKRLFSETNKLHVFVQGQPEGKRRKDGWEVLKHYEYRIEGKEFRLIRIQDFDFTWHLYDFDLKNDLMVTQSWSDMFPNAWLVQVRTGTRGRMGSVEGDDGFFLNNDVIRTYNLNLKRRP
jgi:hypothetical protein